jgi:hypothetical protein
VVQQLGRQDRGGDLYWVQDEAPWRGTHAKKAASPAVKAAACSGRVGSAGPRWASAGLLAGPAGRVGPTGSAQSGRIGFQVFFSNLFLIPETIPENLEIVLKAQKYSKNHKKNPGKFPELDWGMNNANKVFGAHEKDFKAF